MARSVISNTHFRGNGQVPRTRSSNAGHYNAPPQFYRRTKTHDSAAISAYGKSGGTLSDFENYIESAIPLPDDRTDQGSEMLIEPVEIKKPTKAKIKTKKPAGKKSAAKKKAAPKKKTAPKKRMAAKTRKPAAKRNTTKKSTVKKAAPKAKVARKTSHPKKQPKTAAKNKKSSAAIFGNPAVHMQAETMVVRTGPCQSFQYGSSEFQLSTITSNSKEISSMPWQEIVRGDTRLPDAAKPLPRSAAIELYRSGGLLGQIGYWFRQSARRMLTGGSKPRMTKDGKARIRAHEMLGELNRLAAENKQLKARLDRLEDSQ